MVTATLTKRRYRDMIAAAAEAHRAMEEKSIEAWRKQYKPDEFLGMYSPPGYLGVQAQLEGFLYRMTGKTEYAEAAKRLLLSLERFQDIVPDDIRRRHPEYEEGITAFEPLFQGPHFLQGYLDVKDSGVFSPAERETMERSIRTAVRAMFHFPEWGAHNRSMLRAQALTLAIEALGDTEETREWAKLRDYLAQESFGHWSIEDAELYLPLWLISCMIVAERTGIEKQYYALPQTKFYFDYIVRLLTPYGQIPDFGDSHHNSNWFLWLVILEKGASVYRCGHMKYAANLIFEYESQFTDGTPNAYHACFYTIAHRWADDSVEPVRPDWGSGEALEDVIGKKMVFRSGWHPDDAYLLLNYRDEGDYAKVVRDYMGLTINAPAEKVHHGHADENSVSLLASKRNILLYDGGYRDGAPNGRYRADLYHNRLVFRDGRPAEGSSMYDFLHDNGHYHRVAAEKLHFQTFDELAYSRTRVRDEYRGFLWDRAVVYLPEDEAWLVVDWAEALRDGEKTIANLWHPGAVLSADDGVYVGQVPHIYLDPGNPKPRMNRKELALLIEFAACGEGGKRPNGRETIRRCYGDSEMVYEWDASVRKAGDRCGFVTALTPFASGGAAPAGRIQAVRFSDDRSRLSVEYAGAGGRTLHLAFKLDLRLGALEIDDYPKYSWESGKHSYGSIATDADFAFVSLKDGGEGRYGYVNGCGIEFGGRLLHRTPQMSGYSFATKTFRPSDHRWRAWDGAFTLH